VTTFFTIALASAVATDVDDDVVVQWWLDKGSARHRVARVCRVVSNHPTHAVLIEDLDGSDPPAAASQAFDGAADLLAPRGLIVGREIYAAEAGDELTSIPVGAHLFLPQLNVDAEIESDFNDWYDHVHIPMVEDAGLRKAHRYVTEVGLHRYFARYVMDDADTLSSDAIQAVRGFDHFTGRVYDLTRLVLRILA
jgi:hypothetical protein